MTESVEVTLARIDERTRAMHATIGRIDKTTEKQDARIDSLEKWRSGIVAGIATIVTFLTLLFKIG